MNIKALNDSLSTKIGLLKQKIQIENKVNDLSTNVLMESSAGRILNNVFEFDLVNANLIERNFPGVDLVDKESGLMVQVSTTSSVEKIIHTLKQISKNGLDKEYRFLKFFFLSDIRTMTDKSKNTIRKHVPKGVEFNLENDIISLNEIYSILYNEQDASKSLMVLNVLDEVLGFIPESKSTGYESICVATEDNNEYAKYVINSLLREGINVYISSMRIYEEFINEENWLRDYLILVNDSISIDHIKFTIVVINDQYVKDNDGLVQVQCPILSKALSNDARIQLVNFNNSFTPTLVRNENLKNSIPCSEENVDEALKNIIANFLKEEDSIAMSLEDITSELCKIRMNYTLTIVNQDKKVGFRFLKFEEEEFPDMSLYYILLSKGYVLSSVESNINKHYSKVPRNRIVVLVPKDPMQKTNRRINNIKKSLKTERVQYVSEHLFEKTLKREVQQPILDIDDFVEPIISSQGNKLNGSDAILNWVTVSSSCSVAIISGQGGIGKTTLCKKIHDKLIGEGNNYYVIFISSEQLMNDFLKVDFTNEHEYEIYNLYLTSYKTKKGSNSSVLDRNSFEINYELGNILIVFDGIDELISTIPTFTLELFLKNVSKIEAGIGRGKIIVNCRDTYIDDYEQGKGFNEKLEFDRFELLPFDKELAEDYFNQHFTQPKKITSCIELLEDFVASTNGQEDKYIYPPFVVEIVRLFVEKDIEIDTGDLTFQSDFLVEENPNDLIVYKTCNREVLKKEDHGFELTVDRQVEFMMEVAHNYQGRFQESEFEKILRSIGCLDRTTEIALGLRDHPFLIKKEGMFFRFEFLNRFFKSIRIKSILDNPRQDLIDKRIVNLFAEDLDINSQTSLNLVPKVKKDLNFYIKNGKEVIEIFRNFIEVDGCQVKKAISNIFMLLIQVSGINDVEKTRSIIRNLFAGVDDDHIIGFYLLDVPNSVELKFDFRDFYFSGAFIENYESFLLCTFNDNSFFESSCTINKVEQRLSKKKEISVSINHFDSHIKGDNSLMKSLSQGGEHTENAILSSVISSIKLFNKCFYEGNILKNTKSIRELRTNYLYGGGTSDLNKITELMVKHKILIKSKDFLKIKNIYTIKLSKSLNQGLNFHELNLVIHELIEYEKGLTD
ncbi:MAG: SMEK domain-containing protein [Crocinitomicaceae bacterium]|nr:SMEK domain-containing protein [Flavobacteriales bacterium]NQZ36647.1 SMEK domain-containing protein [Crocinitomicaceae bacterium]